MGPVVEGSALKKHLEYIEIGKQEGRLAAGRRAALKRRRRATSSSRPSSPTWTRTGRLAQEEIFGPVLAVIKARDFDEALAIANNTEYGLTGSVYSMRRDRLEQARREFHVGNLYLQPQVHGRAGGQAALRRLQHERHRFEGRRAGLPAAVYAGQGDQRDELGQAGAVPGRAVKEKGGG